jgi:hypothetical protein
MRYHVGVALYFYLLENNIFTEQIQPAFAASWCQRSFASCRALCRNLIPAAAAFKREYHLDVEDPLLGRVARDLPFSRNLWHYLVGEVLMMAAVAIPEIATAPETLTCLLAPEQYRAGDEVRQRFVPIQQAHFGSRDLRFGGGFYRPERAGWNNAADVQRLAVYLAAVDSAQWTTADLVAHRDLSDDSERAEELEIAREWFPGLRELYQKASKDRLIIVSEMVG